MGEGCPITCSNLFFVHSACVYALLRNWDCFIVCTPYIRAAVLLILARVPDGVWV